MKLHFVELQVSDWNASVAWYETVLGLRVELLDEEKRFALLTTESCRLALKAGEPASQGVLLAFQVQSLSPFVTLSDDVKISDEGYHRLRLRDPDGHSIVLFEWRGDQV